MRTLFVLVAGIGLFAVGWTTGQARYPEPDFEVFIQAPPGKTVIECRRGCDLFWIERGGPGGGADPQASFNFGCSGAGVQQCNSGRIGGWIRKK